MKWGNFCPWPKISLAILKMNRNCLHWLRMPLMFLHPFHFPNFPFSSVLLMRRTIFSPLRVFFYFIIAKGSEMAIFTFFQNKLLNSPYLTTKHFLGWKVLPYFPIFASITKWKIAISIKIVFARIEKLHFCWCFKNKKILTQFQLKTRFWQQ